MTAAALAVLLALPCDLHGLERVPPARRAAACELASRPAPAPVEMAPLAPLYARPGFERARLRNEGTWALLLRRARAWLQALLESSGAETYSNLTRVAVLAVALALGAGVALRWRTRRAVPRRRGERPAGAPPLDLDDAAVHVARARAQLEGDPRAAIREGLLALLSTLERRRLARPDRVKTNRELAHELSTRGAPDELVAAVRPLFAWFDRAWYSLAPVSVDDARRFLDGVQGVIR